MGDRLFDGRVSIVAETSTIGTMSTMRAQRLLATLSRGKSRLGDDGLTDAQRQELADDYTARVMRKPTSAQRAILSSLTQQRRAS